MFKTTVTDLLEKALLERTDLFLIDMSISEDNQIKIVIDGDTGVSVEDCMFVSRAREPKPQGKGKVTVKKEAVIAYSDIVEAKVMIKF